MALNGPQTHWFAAPQAVAMRLRRSVARRYAPPPGEAAHRASGDQSLSAAVNF